MKKRIFGTLSLVLCLLIVMGTSMLLVGAQAQNSGRYQGMNNLGIMSISHGDNDAAIKASAGVIYIPAGTYVITEPIILNSGTIKGAGMDKTVIVADFDDPRQPIVVAGYKTSISDIQFCYKEGLVTGKEARGERVGLFGGYTMTLQKGSYLRNVKFSNVGTGLYAVNGKLASDLGLTAPGKDDKELMADVFSVTMENIVVEDFSFAGIDFISDSRTGNVMNNIYLSSGKYACQSAMILGGGESETHLDMLTVADTRAVTPLVFDGISAIDAGTVTLKNVSLISKKDKAYVYWNESAGVIDHFSVNDLKVESGETIFEIGGSHLYRKGNRYMNHIDIGKFTLADVTNMTFAGGFTYFKRASGENDRFYVTVNEYYYDADQVEREVYRAFPTSDVNLIYTKKGQIRTEGSTALRPTARLCPYYTEYKDTTLGKTVIWTGEEWK
ncbi:MAG: hypothetical protein J6B93_04945 [Clostridia bacterium]|nr:hypothetical protein [Clostridia bacterium]